MRIRLEHTDVSGTNTTTRAVEVESQGMNVGRLLDFAIDCLHRIGAEDVMVTAPPTPEDDPAATRPPPLPAREGGLEL